MSYKTLEVGIAVDFGMTGSAVSWKTADDPQTIHTITQWPSAPEPSPKVPTKIKIDSSGISWGFQCNSDNGFNIKELFKILLDPTEFDSPDRTRFCQKPPQDMDELEDLVRDYLRSLIAYSMTIIGNELQQKFGTINSPIRLQMDYVLTTPTTWHVSTVRLFRSIAGIAIESAFKAPGVQIYAPSLKQLRCDITEPDAAACYFLHANTHLFANGDTFMLLDLGGATSDPCVLHVAMSPNHWACWPLSSIPGLSRGSSYIDQQFQLDVRHRLQKAGLPEISNVAFQMSQDPRFQAYKRGFSGMAGPNQPDLYIPIPNCDRKFSHRDAGIFNGQLLVCNLQAVTGLFDDQLKTLVLDSLKPFPNSLKLIVLAGGGGERPSTQAHLNQVAHVHRSPGLDGVARGSLIKWNQQLLSMEIVVQGEKFFLGTSRRKAGEEIMSHTWRIRAKKGVFIANYRIHFELVHGQRWQIWELEIKAAELLPLGWSNLKQFQDTPVAFRVDLKLPRVSPYVSGEDFEAFGPNKLKVPFTATMSWISHADAYSISS